MRGGLWFSPFVLSRREVVSRPGAENEVVRLRFSLPGGGSLGLTQPTTHVKARNPRSCLPRGRTFSLVSEASADGYFEIAVKIRPGGRVSPFLGGLAVGDRASFAKTLTKRLAAPLDGPDARGKSLAIVVFGVGATESVLTARRALEAGQRVALVLATRTAADLLFLPELCALVAASGGGGASGSGRSGGGSFALHILLSREEPSAALRAELQALVEAAAGSGRGPAGAAAVPTAAAAAASASVVVERGRVDARTIGRVFGGAEWAGAAALAVGTKAQAREAYALLAEAGPRKKLLGSAILWGCW